MVDGKRFLLFLLFCFSLHASETCFFIPPKGWIPNLEICAPRVHICFLEPTSAGTPPTINLATEAVNVSLDAYIEEVRKIHSADPNSRWRDLGKFKSLLGDGRLFELETPAEAGMVRMVQLVVIKEGIAYILTASAAKERFSKYYQTFDEVLRSLQASSNLTASYPSCQLKTLVEELSQKYQTLGLEFSSDRFQEEVWKPFVNKIIKDFTEMGSYWQILFLQEVQTIILTPRSI